MCLLEEIPSWLKYIYRLAGIIQFSFAISETRCSKIFPRLWCVPLCLFYLYASFLTLTLIVAGLQSEEIFTHFDLLACFVSIVSVATYTLIFNNRSNQLKSLLVKVNQIKSILLHSPNRRSSRNHWLTMGLLGVIAANATFTLFFPMTVMVLFCVLPPMLSALDHLFLSDLLSFIGDQFDSINQHLQRQINSVDLSKLFPFTKVEKIKVLKEDEISFNIKRIQELSLLHYDLVHLATEISKLFDITTIISMIMWFAYVIDIMYMIVFFMVNNVEPDPACMFWFMGSCLVFFWLWLFIIVRTYSRTQEKANRTATYIHDIWNKYDLNEEVDRRVRHLQLISIRLLNTKLQFTAKNFFNLDWTFCHLMISAITTYVVILIQFHM